MSDADLGSADPAIRIRAMAALAASDADATAPEIAAVLDGLADEGKLVQRRAAECIAALAARGADVVADLRDRVRRGSLRARWGAVYALSLIDDPGPEAVETLVEALGLADGDLRWASVDLLTRVATRNRAPVVARLIDVAETATPTARKMALYALRGLDAREPRCIAAAVLALDATDVDLRLAGLSALSRLTDDHADAAARITRLVEDPDERMRRAAAAVLGTLDVCPPAARAALDRARVSADPSLRRAAERSLQLLARRSS